MTTLNTAAFMRIRKRRPLTLTIIMPYILVTIIVLYLLLSTQILIILRWHYVGGGSAIEKLHPATYLLIPALCVSLFLDQRFRRQIAARITSDRSLVLFATAIVMTTAYTYAMSGASIAPFIDTFLAAILSVLIISCLSHGPLNYLRLLIHIFFIINIALIFFESMLHYDLLSSSVRAVVRTPEELVVLGPQGTGLAEGRAWALFGHPLNAATLLGTYSIAILVSKPMRFSLAATLTLVLSMLSYLAIFPTGGRSSIVAASVLLLLYMVYSMRGIARGYINTAGVTFALFGGVALTFTCIFLWSAGFFETMLARFEYDYGSSLSRDYALEMLKQSGSDIWFGLPQDISYSNAAGLGLIAIEISWVNFILTGGLITAVPLFITFFLFLFRSLPLYCTAGIYFVSMFILESTFASNSIWSKTTVLTGSLILGLAFLKRDNPPDRIYRQQTVKRANINRHFGQLGSTTANARSA